MRKLSEVVELVECFYTHLHPKLELICNEKMKVDQTVGKEALEASLQLFQSLAEKDFTAENIKAKLIEIITQKSWKNGQLLWPLRAALTGVEASPGAFEVAEVLGKEESIKRITTALKLF
jgi:glutamyl-tRNA synthetase